MTNWELAVAIGTALIAVIGTLWGLLVSVWKEKKERLASLESDKERLIKEKSERDKEFYDKMLQLSTQVAEMEGRREGEAEGVEMVVTRTLQAVKDAQLEAYKRGQQDKHTHE
jgi:uncharacterized membrane protein YhiD involved in acid resistance